MGKLSGPRRDSVRDGHLTAVVQADEAVSATATGRVNVPNLSRLYRLAALTHSVTANAKTELKIKVPKKALRASEGFEPRHGCEQSSS